jgi:hypothetical protein
MSWPASLHYAFHIISDSQPGWKYSHQDRVEVITSKNYWLLLCWNILVLYFH